MLSRLSKMSENLIGIFLTHTAQRLINQWHNLSCSQAWRAQRPRRSTSHADHGHELCVRSIVMYDRQYFFSDCRTVSWERRCFSFWSASYQWRYRENKLHTVV